jgi:hypothetical protein
MLRGPAVCRLDSVPAQRNEGANRPYLNPGWPSSLPLTVALQCGRDDV